MTTISPCLQFSEGQNLACERPQSNRHFQVALFYKPKFVEADFSGGKYRGVFNLPSYRDNATAKEIIYTTFTAPPQSSAIKGKYKKGNDNFGYSEYTHEVSILTTAFTERDKHNIHALNNGIWKVILFGQDRNGEIYGSNFGLRSADYNYENAPNIITFKSIKPESAMPLFFDGEKLIPGQEPEDEFKIFNTVFNEIFG